MAPVSVYFWGTRGSLPASVTAEKIRIKVIKAVKAFLPQGPLDDKGIETFVEKSLPFSIRGSYGANTPCVEIRGGEEYVICDAGTGLRDFGNHVIQYGTVTGTGEGAVFHLFLSHLHWDHIQGFPFFLPAYIKGNSVNIYGCHRDLEQAFVGQQTSPNFPVSFNETSADIKFILLEPGKEYEIGGFTVKTIEQNHPGGSYGYRFEKDQKSIVYSTDCEHTQDSDDKNYRFLDFFRQADLLIFDAQYPLMDALTVKENWGHSNNMSAIELSVKAQVKRVCIFHNEPTFNDEELEAYLEESKRYLALYAQNYPLEVDLASDGLSITL
jgi:phosphoribosyl 1,2-cyclic phosphodiesterase